MEIQYQQPPYVMRPSEAERTTACPYSLRAPRDEENDAMREGTAAHKWGEKLILGEIPEDDVPEHFRPAAVMYADHVLGNGVTPIVERMLHSIDIPQYRGKIDTLLVHENHAVVYDFKFGKFGVPAEGNKQLLCYADLAREHFQVDTFTGVIVQPRTWHKEKIKMASYTMDEVDAHRERVVWALGSDEKVEGDHCRFCPLRRLDECREGVLYGKAVGWKS